MRWRFGKGAGALGPADVASNRGDSDSLEVDADITTDEDELAYELHEWAGETRLVLDQLLEVRGIARVWQGATLVIRATDENEVDEAVQEAETAGSPTLDPDAEKIVYETTFWGADEQTKFSELLGRLGVAHQFDDQGDLMIEAKDEEAVEATLDTFQVMLDQRPELKGLEANRILTEIFVACDRLRRDPNDPVAVDAMVQFAPVLAEHRPPFGFAPGVWEELDQWTRELVGLLADGDAERTVIASRSRELAEKLRVLV